MVSFQINIKLLLLKPKTAKNEPITQYDIKHM